MFTLYLYMLMPLLSAQCSNYRSDNEQLSKEFKISVWFPNQTQNDFTHGFRQFFLYMNTNIVSLIWTTLSFWPAQKGMFEDLAYFYTTLYLMIFIESIGIAAAPAIKPQLSLPLAKLFTLSRTASNHDFLISILLLAR